MIATAAPLVALADVVREFPSPTRGRPPLQAVAGVSLEIAQGEVFGLVGESGSGKTTLARCLLGLIEPTSGSISFDGHDLATTAGDARRRLRRQVQAVFQDPVGSLDPRLTVRDLVGEPIVAHEGRVAGFDARIRGLVEEVGLGVQHLGRRPHELSGGQCQRVAIARALALRPRLVVLDEPTSSLDVSVQAQILNLLGDLRRAHGLTYLLISHDLSVVRHLTDRVAVMYLGRIVELGPTTELFVAPRHPYTRALLVAAPSVDGEGPAPLIHSDPPSASDPPSGCPFHPRCWLRERLGRPGACETTAPDPVPPTAAHAAACHFGDRVSAPFEEVQS